MSDEPEDSQPPLIRRTWVYHAIMATVHTLSILPFPTRIRGREHVPKSGGALIVCNHASFFDIPLVSKAAGPRHVCFVARKSLANNRIMAFIMDRCGAVLIDPKAGDRKALARVVEHLEAGDLVAMFAEGTRSRDGRLLPFKRGALLAARQARVPVVPCAVIGTHHAFGRNHRLPRPARCEVRLGPALDARGANALDEVRAWIALQLEGTDQADPGPGEAPGEPDPA
ncbi:MAG: lysophospholipid acyltransferase family protein [Planctomycetota bacterium]